MQTLHYLYNYLDSLLRTDPVMPNPTNSKLMSLLVEQASVAPSTATTTPSSGLIFHPVGGRAVRRKLVGPDPPVRSPGWMGKK